jgi:hypothetical protein
MSFKGKDTVSKWGSSRLKSSFGKVANSRFWPVTKILRRFANGRSSPRWDRRTVRRARTPPRQFRFHYHKKILAVMSGTVQMLSF